MSDADENMQRCPAIRKDGTPCRAKATSSGYCFAHDANTAPAARIKGGQNSSLAARSLKLLPERLRPIVEILEATLARTFRGEMEPRRAVAIASVASAIVRCVQAGELEERLRAIEQAAEREHLEPPRRYGA